MKLDDRDMAIVRRILGAMMPEYEIWAFGSRVHGRGLKRFSDIDLAVIADAPVDFTRMCELREAFAESDLPYRVDVVDYASASPSFRDIIQREHEVIQKPREAGGTDANSRAAQGQ